MCKCSSDEPDWPYLHTAYAQQQAASRLGAPEAATGEPATGCHPSWPCSVLEPLLSAWRTVAAAPAAAVSGSDTQATSSAAASVTDVDFRRGDQGEGRIVLTLLKIKSIFTSLGIFKSIFNGSCRSKTIKGLGMERLEVLL